MSFGLEFRKVKRTGLSAAFLGGGILAAAVPALNMAFRSEIYLSAGGSPVSVLIGANWQTISMLNILLIVAGACTLYSIEYADNALQKMRTLPLSESRLFLGKAGLLLALSILFLLPEAASVAACAAHWFGTDSEIAAQVLRAFGFALLLLLPSLLSSLLISSLCRNLWVSLGIGVICVLTATMIPSNRFIPSLFPFALPFRTLFGPSAESVREYAAAAAAETAAFSLLAVIILKLRRTYQ